MPRISVVIPVLNEERTIGSTLDAIAAAGVFEVIVVDGGSSDRTRQIVAGREVKLLEAARGRGPQMHAGAKAAQGEILWFLHADTLPPSGSGLAVAASVAEHAWVGGNCRVRWDGGSAAARWLTAVYPYLSYLGLIYGDSGIFVTAEAYRVAGGFRAIPLFEDLDLLRRLRSLGHFGRIDCELVTSSRRFEGRNFALVFAHWTLLQVLYWLGADPEWLARWYAQRR